MSFVKGGVQISAQKQEKELLKNDKSIVFEGSFTKGKTDMSVWFTTKEKEYLGAFYIKARRLQILL